MQFTRATCAAANGIKSTRRQRVQTVLGAIAVVVVIAAAGLLLVVTSGALNYLPSKDRALYIELSLQSANLVLTVAAVVSHVPRLRTLLHVSRYMASAAASPRIQEQRADAIRAAFPALAIEFQDQANPTGVNIPLRKIWLVLLVLNAQCMLQYPTTFVLWFLSSQNRPYAVVAVCVALSSVCSVAAFVWESRLIRHCTQFRAQRAESAFEKYLVEDTEV
ncbi:hypothetical protein H310_02671 [Aphanomyces invadans]|uniref:Uncharacterized protein n=1 Tax=Aphanomyces invadans TaxID=157072 RepID=A0A024UKQ5_9STRA|nr:hypothetical protein H310_02671 [Aphanomyces invadans]ETW06402.1 hypothetical protein H310_02671 [Aphanomyces invadans]RHY29192.1 hypothetical protein DYB32_005351 [Aphanomyces invadans]|eukprot:XP_008864477.1 hypothetical protein H310_02671 [Aphanomyces invadans]